MREIIRLNEKSILIRKSGGTGESVRAPLVLLHAGAAEADAIGRACDADRDCPGYFMAAVDGIAWERDLTPWPAPKAFRGGKDFTGGAPAYLQELTECILPVAEEKIRTCCPDYRPVYTAAAGYSLAGLFAVWALFETNVFHRAASASGSFWYDGFTERLAGRSPARLPDCCYFSLGDTESHTANRRLARAEECTAAVRDCFAEKGVPTVFEMNPGGHFLEPEVRMAKGIRWMLTHGEERN